MTLMATTEAAFVEWLQTQFSLRGDVVTVVPDHTAEDTALPRVVVGVSMLSEEGVRDLRPAGVQAWRMQIGVFSAARVAKASSTAVGTDDGTAAHDALVDAVHGLLWAVGETHHDTVQAVCAYLADARPEVAITGYSTPSIVYSRPGGEHLTIFEFTVQSARV